METGGCPGRRVVELFGAKTRPVPRRARARSAAGEDHQRPWNILRYAEELLSINGNVVFDLAHKPDMSDLHRRRHPVDDNDLSRWIATNAEAE
jgi:hypothetical protein